MSSNRLISINMTNFFNRELFMYALGDIKFKKPVSIKKVGYTIVFFIIWTIPILLMFGIRFDPFYVTMAVAPPLVLGHFAAKPTFGGKSLIGWLKSTFTYIGEPKGWTDLRKSDDLDEGVFFVENEIWISRRAELYHLAELREKRQLTKAK